MKIEKIVNLENLTSLLLGEARAIYTQLVEFESEEYCSAVANNVDETKKLIEGGSEYV